MSETGKAVTAQQLLTFIFNEIGESPGDDVAMACADACTTACISLMTIVHDEDVRERALAKMDHKTADCVRKICEVFDAIEAGELEIEPKKH